MALNASCVPCAAWMITYAVMLAIICLAVTAVCCASFLRASDPLLLLVLLLFFAASELAFGLLVASVFSNAKIAGIVAPLAHFAALMPRYIFFRSEAPQVGCPSCGCLLVQDRMQRPRPSLEGDAARDSLNGRANPPHDGVRLLPADLRALMSVFFLVCRRLLERWL